MESIWNTSIFNFFFQILCTSDPLKLRWYSTTSEEFSALLQDKTVLRAGVNTEDVPFYVGRVFFRDQQIIGRIKPDGDTFEMESLYWAAGGYYYHKSTTFDALVYEDPFNVKDRRT